MRYEDSIRQIKGVGEKAEQRFHKLDIWNVGDLLEHYPRGYDEFHDIVKIAEVKEGEMAAVEGVIVCRPSIHTTARLKIISIVLEDETGRLPVTWFNMPFLANRLKMGTRYILRGKVGRKNGKVVLEQPKMYSKNEFFKQVGRMHPIYPLTAGLTNHAVEKAVRDAIGSLEGAAEFLPADLRKRQNLLAYRKAIHDIHFPKNQLEYRKARKRLVFDEFFLYQAALQAIRIKNYKPSSHVMIKKEELGKFVNNLPYELTAAQKRVYEEIEKDMTGGMTMNRLVQGDVGSGKTVVAVMALFLAVCNGAQGAFMVPTEVLAMQHKESLEAMLAPYGVKIGLLIGSMTAKEKREAYQRIAAGEVQIVLGTHALIQEKVEYQNLALVVTDEQHRFGVRQREALAGKGQIPHILVMSATPIPRTLAIILYGDLDISVIDELPANRLPIKNCVVDTSYRPTAYRFMQKQVAEGRQCYVICPMVEESEAMDAENVLDYSEQLKEIFPAGITIECLHGKMKPKEKNEVMQRFIEGTTDILVSTTVIEVGIDVPNATVMMIENAERFGLAQLHQLRGRVGRGKEQSYCILMYGKESREGKERLSILAGSNDGFEIAREDLKLRGQGDFFGVMQSGDKLFSLADIYEDAPVLKAANEEAKNYAFDEVTMFYKKNRRLVEKLNSYMGNVSL